METKIIDGRKLRDEILADIKRKVALLPFVPVFCDVLVGDDSASLQYVKMKGKTAESIGIRFHNASFPGNITTEALVQEIKKVSLLPHMCGIIVQLPLPTHIDKQAILNAIDAQLDVDCLGTAASEKFYSGDISVGPPAALACMHILDSLGMDLTDRKIVVLGQGKLVGRPVSALFRYRGMSAAAVDSRTENKETILKEADIIISGIGKGAYLSGAMIKEGAVLIDAGTTEEDGGIVGDIDLHSVQGIAGAVSPVPGGVGPVTVAMLLQNVLKVAQTHESNK